MVCQRIPNERKRLQTGDVINIDITVILDGWHGDTSRMFFVGQPKVKASRLVEVTYEAMMRGIEVVRPGATLGDVGEAIQSFAEGHGFSVVRDFCGHGLGRIFHTAPSVLHYGTHGLRHWPETGLWERTPKANSCKVALPTTTAPAARRRRTTGASSFGTKSW